MSKVTIQNVLLVDQSNIHKELIENVFLHNDSIIGITQASNTADILNQLEKQHWQCLLLAIDSLPLSIPELLDQMPTTNQNTPLIVLVEKYNRKQALKYLSTGAYDVLSFDELEYLVQSMFKGLQKDELTQTLKFQRDAIKSAHDRFRALTTQLPIAVAFIHEGAFINVNPEFQRFFNISNNEELAGTSFLDLISATDIEKIKQVFTKFNHEAELNNEKISNIHFSLSTGEERASDLTFTRSNISQESGLQIIIHPHPEKITPQIINEEENALLSPEFFAQSLDHLIRDFAKENKADNAYALCFFEIDHYTKYKKRIGITRSDIFFHQISEYIATLSTEDIQISQLNIDVFTILVTAKSKAACEHMITTLQQQITQEEFTVDENKLSAHINLGLVHISDQIESSDQALSLADVACTVSRNKNLHLMHVYTKNEDRSTVETVDFSWSGRIKDALKNDNFKLVYHPILHIKNEPTPLYEVLLRMKSSRGNDIMPGQFLHTAKLSGQEEDIDKWVITQILTQLEKTQNRDTSFFINLSETSINSINFINWVQENCPNYSQNIVFEISEQQALTYTSEVMHFIQETKKIGCHICIEHYGSQPDGLETLSSMDVDYYKIDGTFINHLATNRKHQSIIHNIASQITNKDVKTIACFVQDADSLAILWREGIDYIQGNYLQIPDSQLSYKFEAQI